MVDSLFTLTTGARNKQVVERLRSGDTLASVGVSLGVSRQRVLQIAQAYGVDASAGIQLRRQRRQKDFAAEQDARCRSTRGLSYTEYRRLLGLSSKPTYAFQQQRRNAKLRGIPWHLSLGDWWRVWEASGRWSERGRGGYGLWRIGNRGAYAVGNVVIRTAEDNDAAED